MENSDKYLTYEDYQELGGTLDLKSFNLLEYKSRKQVDYYTHNRLMDGVPTDIKFDIDLLMYNLIDKNNKIDKAGNKSSERIDGYSVSYGSSQQSSDEIEHTIEMLLSGVELNGEPLTYSGGVNDNKHVYYPIS